MSLWRHLRSSAHSQKKMPFMRFLLLYSLTPNPLLLAQKYGFSVACLPYEKHQTKRSGDFHGGEGGIRTLDELPHTAFRERPVQPLLHLSIKYIV